MSHPTNATLSGPSASLSSHLVEHLYAQLDKIKGLAKPFKAATTQPSGSPSSPTSTSSSSAKVPSLSLSIPSKVPSRRMTASSPSQSDRHYLLYSDLIRMQCPSTLPCQYHHIAILYLLDQSHQGKPTINDLMEFTVYCESKLILFESHEFQSRLEGLGLLKIWRDAYEKGIDYVVDWLCKLVIHNKAPITVDTGGANPNGGGTNTNNVLYIHRDSILPLFKSLQSYLPTEYEHQDFFNLLQLTAESTHLLDLEEEVLDNYVPLSIVRFFIYNVVNGMMIILRSIGLEGIVGKKKGMNGADNASINNVLSMLSKDNPHVSALTQTSMIHKDDKDGWKEEKEKESSISLGIVPPQPLIIGGDSAVGSLAPSSSSTPLLTDTSAANFPLPPLSLTSSPHSLSAASAAPSALLAQPGGAATGSTLDALNSTHLAAGVVKKRRMSKKWSSVAFHMTQGGFHQLAMMEDGDPNTDGPSTSAGGGNPLGLALSIPQTPSKPSIITNPLLIPAAAPDPSTLQSASATTASSLPSHPPLSLPARRGSAISSTHIDLINSTYNSIYGPSHTHRTHRGSVMGMKDKDKEGPSPNPAAGEPTKNPRRGRATSKSFHFNEAEAAAVMKSAAIEVSSAASASAAAAVAAAVAQTPKGTRPTKQLHSRSPSQHESLTANLFVNLNASFEAPPSPIQPLSASNAALRSRSPQLTHTPPQRSNTLTISPRMFNVGASIMAAAPSTSPFKAVPAANTPPLGTRRSLVGEEKGGETPPTTLASGPPSPTRSLFAVDHSQLQLPGSRRNSKPLIEMKESMEENEDEGREIVPRGSISLGRPRGLSAVGSAIMSPPSPQMPPAAAATLVPPVSMRPRGSVTITRIVEREEDSD